MAGLFLLVCACAKPAETAAPKVVPVKAEVGEAPAPVLLEKENPARIKVKRDKDGSYSWEITGKEVKGIIEADRALKRRLVQDEEKGK